MKPIDLAIRNGHWEVAHILHRFVPQPERVQEDELKLSSASGKESHSNCSVGYASGTSKRNSCSDRDDQQDCGSNKEMTATERSEASSEHTCPWLSLQSNHRIIQAKNELLLLIEEFKCGISIECFEQMFSNWEATYKDVLEGQMSHEMQNSLKQIKKLCSFNDHEENYEEEGYEDEQCEDVTQGYARSATEEKRLQGNHQAEWRWGEEANRFGGNNEAIRNEPNVEWANIIRTHAHADDRLEQQLNHRPHWNTSDLIALHHKVMACFANLQLMPTPLFIDITHWSLTNRSI